MRALGTDHLVDSSALIPSYKSDTAALKIMIKCENCTDLFTGLPDPMCMRPRILIRVCLRTRTILWIRGPIARGRGAIVTNKAPYEKKNATMKMCK